MHTEVFMIDFKKKLNGSITVEAAFSFTIMIFVLFLMLGPLLMIKTTSDVLIKLNDASKTRCNYEMLKNDLSDTEISEKINSKLEENESSPVNINTIENIVNFGSMILDFNDEYGDDKSEYRNIDYIYNKYAEVYNNETDEVLYDFVFGFTLPYNLYHIEDVRKRLVSNRRAFIGAVGDRFALTEESGDFVYVANNHVHSNIYHLFIDCTYLVKKTKSFEYRDIPSQRNDANHTYSKCDYCFKRINLQDDTVCYITEYGDRFHYKSDCPLMTAYITKILKEKIDQYDLNLCSRCNRRESK